MTTFASTSKRSWSQRVIVPLLLVFCLLSDVIGDSTYAARTWSTKFIPKSLPAIVTKRFPGARRRSLKFIGKSARTFGGMLSGTGVYYGLCEESMPKKRSSSVNLDDTAEALKGVREELRLLKREMASLKKRLGIEEGDDGGVSSALLARQKRLKEFERVGKEVEEWAHEILYGDAGKGDQWKEVHGAHKYNKDGRTKCFLSWMKDSRGRNAIPGDDVHPCLKIFSIIDAPVEDVCAYLADENRVREYNDLVVKHRDLEEISPHSKICWGQSPQILFVKPRDFVTFCYHRWRRDGTGVLVSQACEHRDAPGVSSDGLGVACRAYALRGANFLSPHPDDPNKTRFILVVHANPGGGLPHWLSEKAVNWLAPSEPFKLVHRINENVKRAAPYLDRAEMVTSNPARSGRPVGGAFFGYACFWPNGGGLKEGTQDHRPPPPPPPAAADVQEGQQLHLPHHHHHQNMEPPNEPLAMLPRDKMPTDS